MQPKLRAAILSLVCLFVWPLTASAQKASTGPFGLRRGLTKVEAEKFAGPLTQEQPGIYKAARVPQPSPDFESYGLVITPSLGLCAILADGKTLQIDSRGTQIQSAFGSLKHALALKYGDPSRVDDFLRPGSKIDKPEEWALGLAKEERILSAAWKLKSNPAGLSVIRLDASGLSSSKAYLRLMFGFDNGDACADELKKMRR